MPPGSLGHKENIVLKEPIQNLIEMLLNDLEQGIWAENNLRVAVMNNSLKKSESTSSAEIEKSHYLFSQILEDSGCCNQFDCQGQLCFHIL